MRFYQLQKSLSGPNGKTWHDHNLLSCKATWKKNPTRLLSMLSAIDWWGSRKIDFFSHQKWPFSQRAAEV